MPVIVFSLEGVFSTDLQAILAHSRQVCVRKLVSYRTKRGRRYSGTMRRPRPVFGLQNGVILKALSNFVRYGGKEAQSGG